jgi:DNA-binding PadR family transcriptional regulator
VRGEQIVSPVFRHGGLRLYLLKLLDEAPRHGYDVIRLLQDRFLGVYSPSPGTIYPRLARLEEEGLVTHDLVDGKKVYKITDKGREELNQRLDDLADLEDELSASVRDIAREITRDVRETVRSLRDEFTWAVREAGRTGSDAGRRDRPASTDGPPATTDAHADGDRASAEADEAQAQADHAQAEADRAQAAADHAQAEADAALARADRAREGADDAQGSSAATEAAADEASSAGDTVWSEAAGQEAPSAQDAGESPDANAASRGDDRSARGERQHGRWPSGGWREWADWAERRDWREWAAWAEQRDWGDWASKQEWKDRVKASQREWKEWAKAGKREWAAGGARRREADRELIIDLERLAAAFARELRGVAWQAEALSEDAVGNLGRILTDALNRIRNEVFRPQGQRKEDS